MRAVLALADGTILRGRGFGAQAVAVGELCFNTAMSGYQEILTDPSYARQIVTLTYPHIGNVGVNGMDAESARIHCAGLVIRDLPAGPSNWRSERGLSAYLADHGVPGIAELDTRRLTRILREKGAQGAALAVGDDPDAESALAAARAFPGLAGMDLAKEVSCDAPYAWAEGSGDPALGYAPAEPAQLPRHVVVYDFGTKRNILRMLVDRGCRITMVPARTPAREVLALGPDGVLFSNGPGDPEPVDYGQRAMQEIIAAGIPSFGLCLGHQLLGLALGARTVKMKFGHHGANHPVKDLDTGRVLITSQNHGFAVDAETLPDCLRVTHVSLFDGSLQGLAHRDLPVLSFQGHPEASPGPHDAGVIFDRFVALIDQHREARHHA